MTDKLPETNSPASVPEGEEEEDAVADSGNGSPVDVHQDPFQTYSGTPKENFEGEPTTREGMRLLNEKYRALKELIPSCSETNREPEKVLSDAAEYLKFLQHQVAGLHQMSGLGPFSAPHAAAGLHPMSGLGPFPEPPRVQGNNQANSSQTNQEAINASPGLLAILFAILDPNFLFNFYMSWLSLQTMKSTFLPQYSGGLNNIIRNTESENGHTGIAQDFQDQEENSEEDESDSEEDES